MAKNKKAAAKKKSAKKKAAKAKKPTQKRSAKKKKAAKAKKPTQKKTAAKKKKAKKGGKGWTPAQRAVYNQAKKRGASHQEAFVAAARAGAQARAAGAPSAKKPAKKKAAKRKTKAPSEGTTVHWNANQWKVYQQAVASGATHAQAMKQAKGAAPKRRRKAKALSSDKVPVMMRGVPVAKEGKLVTGKERDAALFRLAGTATDNATKRIVRKVLSQTKKPPAVLMQGPRRPRLPRPFGLPSGEYKKKRSL